MRINIGAGETVYEGWVSTNMEELDLLRPEAWTEYFHSDGECIDAILAEAVWEHLSYSNGKIAAETCYRFLHSGGYIRVAVPDGFHPDPSYIEHVRPGGTGAGAGDHQVLYNFRTLPDIFEITGFEVKLLEWWDEVGQFHREPWEESDGFISRSFEHDERNKDGYPHYTMLILDALKP